ncbi:MAG: SpoIID/LytB domain-containing protein [Clostridia bacterium]|nr:SpoIID/LytB domain-containing protein [Clostridia bacterium]
MKRILRALCLLLCLVLLPLSAPAETAAPGESPAPSVRVLLRRLNLTDRVDLVLDGVYTAALGEDVSMAFPQGSKVTVLIREGELYLFYQGMSLHVGSSITLIRNESGDNARTGLRFDENGNLYPGHLALSVKDGLLHPILTLSVEDYLLGVVPYEMSESFPLEALKAQAVCARTYALSKIDPARDYDVVDTTNDQVFKGVNYNYTNAVRAVRETAGVVGTYKGNLAICYYSASNGGQTELVENVWSGRGDWNYYAMTDDPYDLENPESIVRTAKIAKNGAVSDSLRSILFSYILPDMVQQGFVANAENLRIDSISAMSLGGPEFEEPSRYMTELTLTFAWSGRRVVDAASAVPSPTGTPDVEYYFFATPEPTHTPIPTSTPEPTTTPEPVRMLTDFQPASEPATVTIDIFPEVIRDLNLSISGSDNEMLTLTENDTHYILQARRYGHGVGMSQRGAQWMAGKYGKLYHEIMSFYYPGMTLMRVQSGAPVLPTAPMVLAATPAPPATPTPRPTLMPVTAAELPQGAYLAKVANIDDDSSLNLRLEPSQASEVLRRLYKHQQLIVLEVCEDPAWVKVKTDVIEGYVMVSFLEPISATATPAP